jgi:hypothetical protein
VLHSPVGDLVVVRLVEVDALFVELAFKHLHPFCSGFDSCGDGHCAVWVGLVVVLPVDFGRGGLVRNLVVWCCGGCNVVLMCQV